MTIAITGATGELGRFIVDYLLKTLAPEEIVAVGRDEAKLEQLAARGVPTAVADYDDLDALTKAFADVETVMFISASVPGQRVRQHGNVVQAAGAAGVTRIVYTSATNASTSELILAPEHKATEQLIVDSGIPFTILRNNWYTENYVSAAEQAEATGNYTASTGDGRVASASRADYAEAAAVVLTSEGHDGAVYELGGDYAWSGAEFAAALTDILGQEITYISVTPEEHTALLTEAGLDEGTIGFVVALDGNIRDGLLGEVTGDLSRLIGRATTPLAEGLRAALGR